MAKNKVQKKLNASGTFTIPAGVKVIKVSYKKPENIFLSAGNASARAVLAKKSDGEVWAWALGTSGQLGDNTVTTKSSPSQVAGLHKFAQIYSSGSDGCFGRRLDGVVMCWGVGTNGMLGNNSTTAVSSPVQVAGSANYKEIAGSAYTTRLALRQDGTIDAWGVNTTGVLGDNSTTSRSSPTQVAGGRAFVKIYTNAQNSAALTSDGSAFMWGDNSFGMCGDNTTTNRSSPVAVAGGHKFIKLANVNGNTWCGLRTDGKVLCWGIGGVSGQRGDNTISNVSSPVLVAGNGTYIDIVGHESGTFFFAKKADSTWVGWGRNAVGGLGDGTLTDRSSPVAVAGGHKFIKISTDRDTDTSYGLRHDGTIWSWGENGSGQIGNNSVSDFSSPVQIAGPAAYIDVIGGYSAMYARTAAGYIYSSGTGSSGTLGNNTTTSASSPVQVSGQLFSNVPFQSTYVPASSVYVTPGDIVPYSTGIIAHFAGQYIESGVEELLIEYDA